MNTDIQSRLDLLETRLRRHQVVSFVSLALAVLAAAWGWQIRSNVTSTFGTTIEANRFVLRDEKGYPRGVWEINAKNEPSFQIGQPGYPDIYLGRTTDGPVLGLNGATRIYLNAQKEAASLTMWGIPHRSWSENDFKAPVEEQARLANEFCRLGTNGNQFILQSKTGRVDMDAGHINNYGPWLDMTKDDKVRLSMGKGFGTGNVWRLSFKNRDGTPFHETPPTAPPN
jgi:hypothetical protein